MSDSHQSSVHLALGGGTVADVLLWKRWGWSAVLLVGSTGLWYTFERAGYNILSFVSNVLLLLVVILFAWAKSASVLNRPLPPLPNLEISEDVVVKTADELTVWLNHALSIAHDIGLGGNWKLFVKVAGSLWFISYVGGFFSFLTLLYTGVLLSLSLPLLYDKYQDLIDEKFNMACDIAEMKYRQLDDQILSKISFHLKAQ